MYSPQQEIFTLCRKLAIEVIGKNNVYDFPPSEDADYPFIYIGEQFSQDKSNKSTVVGTVQQSFHLYHNNIKKRGTAEKVIVDLKSKLRGVNKTPHFYIDVKNLNSHTILDYSTKVPLLHIVVEVEFKFN